MFNASLEAVLILVLILINGFFALSEMALVASRKGRLEMLGEEGRRGARAAFLLKTSMDRFLSTAQIGITMVAVLTGAVGGATIAARLQSYLAGFPILEPYSAALGLVLVVVPITYFTVILGELVPKKLAVSYPERMSRLTAPVMVLLMRLARPAVSLLTASTRFVFRGLRIAPPDQPQVTEEDIRSLINEAVVYGEVEHAERDLLERVFHLDDLQVSALMTPRSQIVWLDPDDSDQTNLEKVLLYPHARFPVARSQPFEILGVVESKAYLAARIESESVNLEGLAHELDTVPATTRVLSLLEWFRKKGQRHFVLVMDEFNAPCGIVTFNDILDAMVGFIPTVQAQPEPAAVRRDDGSWLLDGFMPLDEVQTLLGIDRPLRSEGQTFDNLAGFVLSHSPDQPMMGQHFDWAGHRFEIIDMDGQRIDRLLVTPPQS